MNLRMAVLGALIRKHGPITILPDSTPKGVTLLSVIDIVKSVPVAMHVTVRFEMDEHPEYFEDPVLHWPESLGPLSEDSAKWVLENVHAKDGKWSLVAAVDAPKEEVSQ